MKVIFLNCTNMDFESNGEQIKGTSIKYVVRVLPKKEGDSVTYVPDKQWIKSEQTELVKIANGLVPGELIDLDYSLDGKKVVFSGITSTGIFAVDFDEVFGRGGD